MSGSATLREIRISLLKKVGLDGAIFAIIINTNWIDNKKEKQFVFTSYIAGIRLFWFSFIYKIKAHNGQRSADRTAKTTSKQARAA